MDGTDKVMEFFFRRLFFYFPLELPLLEDSVDEPRHVALEFISVAEPRGSHSAPCNFSLSRVVPFNCSITPLSRRRPHAPPRAH